MESNFYDTIEPQRQEAMRQTAELAFYHDRRYKFLRYTIISLSGLTPLSIALGQFTGLSGFTIAAFITSTIATVLLGFQKDFGHKEKAKDYYNDSKQLENVHIQYVASIGPYAQAKTTKEKDELYFKEVTPLISKWRTQSRYTKPAEVKPVLKLEQQRVTLPQRDPKVILPEHLYVPPRSSRLKQEYLLDPKIERRLRDFDRKNRAE